MAEERFNIDLKNLKMQPASNLYNKCVSSIVQAYGSYKFDFKSLPYSVMYNVLRLAWQRRKFDMIYNELEAVTVYNCVKFGGPRMRLLSIFQCAVDYNNEMLKKFTESCIALMNFVAQDSTVDKVIEIGLTLSDFLNEGWWFKQSEKILVECDKYAYSPNYKSNSWLLMILHIQLRLARVRTGYQGVSEANDSISQSICFDRILRSNDVLSVDRKLLLLENIRFLLLHCDFKEAYEMSKEAISLLDDSASSDLKIQTLCVASRACVMVGKRNEAKTLILQTMALARSVMSQECYKYADVLIEFAFYLLNADHVDFAIETYNQALNLSKKTFYDGCNLKIASLKRDAAYAVCMSINVSLTTVYDLDVIDPTWMKLHDAIRVMEELLPDNRLMLTSALHVKALLLNNTASLTRSDVSEFILKESGKVCVEAINIVEENYGKNEVLAAVHCVTALGPLFQMMRDFQFAMKCYLKSIEIIGQYLGMSHIEVCVPLGCLGNLLKEMGRFDEAETVYLRCIDICLENFSQSYRELGLFYAQLINLYHSTFAYHKEQQYVNKSNEWKRLRDLQGMKDLEVSNSIPECFDLRAAKGAFLQE